MKILYVISGLKYGGAEKQLVELAKAFVEKRHEVTIYTLNREAPRLTELAGSRVNVILDQKRAKIDPSVLLRLRRYIKCWQPDVVHGFLFDGDFYSRLAAIGTGIPVFNSERSSDYALSPLQWLSHRCTRGLAAGVIANSHAGKEHARKLFKMHDSAIHVVWNGLAVDELQARVAERTRDYRHEFFGDSNVKVACLVGAIKPEKDYALALRTAARLFASESGWRVLFVGDQLSTTGAYKSGILAQRQALGLGDKVKFTGHRNDVAEIIHQSDVLFSTSVREGFPNVVLEAMGVGTPVVSTRYSDIGLILPNRWQVVRERAPESMVRAIMRAYRRRAEVAKDQLEWVHRNATIEMAAQKLENIYVDYIPSPAGGRGVGVRASEGIGC